VDDTATVTVKHGLHYLHDDTAHHFLVHSVLLLDIIQEFASHSCLHNHDELLALDECVEQLYNVFVDQSLQALSFFVDGGDRVCLREFLTYVRELDCNLLLGLLVAGQHHFAETADSKGPAHFVVVKYGAVIEGISCQGDVENVVWCHEVKVFLKQHHPAFVVKFG